MSLPAAISSGFNSGREALGTTYKSWIVEPVGAAGVVKFLFDYEGSTSLTADSDITDHFTEKNDFFNDHVARKPIELTFRGFVGELVLRKPTGLAGALESAQSKLAQVPAYLGDYTPTQLAKLQKLARKTQDVVNTVDNVLQRAGNLVDSLTGAAPVSAQQAALVKLMAMRDGATVFKVSTRLGFISRFDKSTQKAVPRFFTIKRLVVTQEEDTVDASDISITVKEVQFAGASSEISEVADGRAKAQRAAEVNRGLTGGTFVPTTLLPAKLGLAPEDVQ